MTALQQARFPNHSVAEATEWVGRGALGYRNDGIALIVAFVAEQELHADVGDPIRLAVGAGDSLDAAASHEKQADVVGAIERLAPAEIERERALLG